MKVSPWGPQKRGTERYSWELIAKFITDGDFNVKWIKLVITNFKWINGTIYINLFRKTGSWVGKSYT